MSDKVSGLLSGDLLKAMSVLEEMRARGISPNDITFNTLMDAAVRGR